MENIRSFDCTPSPTMKVVMANFSPGISIFNDSRGISEHLTSGSPTSSTLWLEGDNLASCMS